MKVFISSLISGMEAERAAVRGAIELLRHAPIVAEDFGARATTAQVACLTGVRQSDLVVLVLGTRYGAKQSSGLSATHEEYREAQGRKPILAFVEAGTPDPEQAAFIQEAGAWQSGVFWATFSSPAELRDLVTRALHDYTLTHASAPLDPSALAHRAQELLTHNVRARSSGLALHLAVAAGPEAAILRPAEIESADLRDAIEQRALFGNPALFDRRVGTQSTVRSGSLETFQERSHGERAEVRLWSTGDVRVILPAQEEGHSMGFSVAIEETVASRLSAAISYAAWLLAQVDRTERISHVALAAALVGEGSMGWRTLSEHAVSPNSGSFGAFGSERQREEPVMLSPPYRARTALAMDANRLVEDLVVLLRRRWKDPSEYSR